MALGVGLGFPFGPQLLASGPSPIDPSTFFTAGRNGFAVDLLTVVNLSTNSGGSFGAASDLIVGGNVVDPVTSINDPVGAIRDSSGLGNHIFTFDDTMRPAWGGASVGATFVPASTTNFSLFDTINGSTKTWAIVGACAKTSNTTDTMGLVGDFGDSDALGSGVVVTGVDHPTGQYPFGRLDNLGVDPMAYKNTNVCDNAYHVTLAVFDTTKHTTAGQCVVYVDGSNSGNAVATEADAALAGFKASLNPILGGTRNNYAGAGIAAFAWWSGPIARAIFLIGSGTKPDSTELHNINLWLARSLVSIP